MQPRLFEWRQFSQRVSGYHFLNSGVIVERRNRIAPCCRRCYIGQELTARTHHSGVVRKRLMPIIPSSQSDVAYFATAAPDSPILSKDGKSVGKVRAVDGGFGLALMNVADALKDPAHLQLAIDSNNSIPVVTSKPYWWPDSGIEGEIRGFQSTT